jgi:hypothetical protein
MIASLPSGAATQEERRADVRATAQKTLDRLYQLQPKAKAALEKSAGVWLYQLAGDGLALELTAKGTKYYRDDTLN